MNEFDDMLPDAIRRELRREIRSREEARRRTMAAIRSEALAGRRGGWLTPVLSVAIAAGLVVGVALGPVPRFTSGVPGVVVRAGASDAIDTALRDTLLLIRFAMTSPRAVSVALVGDFNGWQRHATALTRESRDGTWRATVALAPGTHRYAFVVNDTEWVTDPHADADAPGGRRASRLIVPKPD